MACESLAEAKSLAEAETLAKAGFMAGAKFVSQAKFGANAEFAAKAGLVKLVIVEEPCKERTTHHRVENANLWFVVLYREY